MSIKTLSRPGFAITFAVVLVLVALLAAFPVHAGGDATGPECMIYMPSTGPARFKFLLRDTESGLASVQVVRTANIGTLEMPTFSYGQTVAADGTAAFELAATDARLTVRAVDVAGNRTTCASSYRAP